MSKKLLPMAASLLIACTSHAYEWGSENDNLPTPPSGQSWKLNTTFSDEFNSWDSNKWQASHDWWDGSGDGRPGAYVEGRNATDTANVAIENSKLMLYARANGPSNEKWVGTSVVASRNKLSYGYYEVRMKASKLSTTSSFWMQGKYSEIDVIEAIGAPKGGAEDFKTDLHSNYHYFPNGFGNSGYQQGPSINSGIYNDNAERGAANGWHTYGVWWKNNREAIIYLDGKSVTDFTYWNSGGATWDKLALPADFNESMVMFFDTEIWNWGNGKPGTPTYAELNATDGSNAMQIEWVRAYSLEQETEVPDTSTAPIGKTITIQSIAGNNSYVWANPNDGKLHANSNQAGSWGEFIIEQGASSRPGTIAIKHSVSGQYLQCACGNNGSGEIILTSNPKGWWESFNWNALPNNQFSLTAYNGKVIYASIGINGAPLFAYDWSTNTSDNAVSFTYQVK